MLFQDPQEFQLFKKNFRSLTYAQFEENYRRVDMLGTGTFGSVFKVQSVKSGEGQYLAIKQFNRNATKNFRQIIREVDNLRKLQHINIVRFYDCYIIDNFTYIIVIEYCERGNLNQILNGKNGLTDLEKLVIVQQIAEGLAYAHSQMIVHRDLKPENIFIGADGKVKIGDFGCSIQMNHEESVMASRLGSLAYMDKRVSDGDPYDMSVDIYSFGIIIYCIYKGKGIYDECTSQNNLLEVRNNIYNDYESNMSNMIKDLPEVMKNIVMGCLQSEYTKRPKASEIAKIVSKEIEARKSLKSIVSSTMDDENIEDQTSLFALGIINYCKNIEQQQRNSVTKQKLFHLLHNYKAKFTTILQIENINYVYPKTKQQFSVFVLFYYFFWLHHLEQFIQKKYSLFLDRYPQIDINSIDQDLMGTIEKHLFAERQKYEYFIMKSCRNINSKLKLAGQNIYIPNTFREIVRIVSMNSNMSKVQYEQFQDYDLKRDLKLFYERRVVKQYDQNKESQDQSDIAKLEKLKELCQSLQ